MKATRPSRRRRAAGFLAVVALGSCVPPPAPQPPLPDGDPLGPAVAALERDDFDAAVSGLERWALRCEAETALRHRALLLLATVELDVANPRGTPGRAAKLSARLIRDREAAGDEVALARSLYRLAMDRGAAAPAEDDVEPCPSAPGTVDALPARAGSEAEDAAGRPLPGFPAPTTDETLTELRTRLALVEDSARILREAARRSATRVAELEAELERIRTLLRGRPPPR